MFSYLREKIVFFYKAAYIVSNFYLGKQKSIEVNKKNDYVVQHVYMCCK